MCTFTIDVLCTAGTALPAGMCTLCWSCTVSGVPLQRGRRPFQASQKQKVLRLRFFFDCIRILFFRSDRVWRISWAPASVMSALKNI